MNAAIGRRAASRSIYSSSGGIFVVPVGCFCFFVFYAVDSGPQVGVYFLCTLLFLGGKKYFVDLVVNEFDGVIYL